MKTSDIPAKFPVAFGASAGGTLIHQVPTASQIGITDGAASLTTGFVPLNATPKTAGGVPPFITDMNGILNQATAWNRWQNAGAPVAYDAGFSSAVGGYPQGAVIAAATLGYFWFSLVDDNTSNPDAGGANWVAFSTIGGATVGDVSFRPTAEILPGRTRANGLTIGNGSSGATEFASPTAGAQFAWLWGNFPNSQCPVSGGRGANAAADFGAGKTIQTLDLRGYMPIGLDTMGNGPAGRFAAVPFAAGNASTPGSLAGENAHSLVQAENGPHAHGTTQTPHIHWTFSAAALSLAGGTIGLGAGVNQSQALGASNADITINSAGTGNSHNTVSFSMPGTWYIHL